MNIRPRIRHHVIQVLAALGIAITLGGCIVVPLGGPGYFRPHYYRYY